MSYDLTGKVVLLTGAAGGIGAATAQVLRARGATVFLTDISPTALEALQSELAALPGQGAARAADLTSGPEVDALFGWAEAEFGGVDCLVNNAGIATVGKLQTFLDEDWDRTLEINLKSLYRTTRRYALNRISTGRGGAIVNVASMAYKGMTQQIAYSSSKGGVVTMTKSTAMELARYGVRANAVAPGMTETNMVKAPDGVDDLRDRMLAAIPLRRYAQPSEIATIIAFLLSDDSSYVTGEVIHASGGARL